MANRDLSGEPHNVDDDFWWYEEPQGICLIIRHKGETLQRYIKWHSIRAALTRKDKQDKANG